MRRDKSLSDKPSFETLDGKIVLGALHSGPEGLSREEAQNRLEIHGYNEFIPSKEISPVVIFLRQFANLLMIILILAAGISFSWVKNWTPG